MDARDNKVEEYKLFSFYVSCNGAPKIDMEPQI
jgi:hypothetical protein